jgi:hypothetical protein
MKETSINQKIFKLQREIGAISKDTKNPFYKSNYADINSILKQLDPLLEKYKLIKWQPTEYDYESNETIVTSFLECSETSQRSPKSSLPLPKNLTDPQKVGSCITYYRRYTLASLLGLHAEDDDANIASGITTKKPFLNKNTPLFNTIKDKIKAGTPLSTVKSHYNAKKEVWDELNEL